MSALEICNWQFNIQHILLFQFFGKNCLGTCSWNCVLGATDAFMSCILEALIILIFAFEYCLAFYCTTRTMHMWRSMADIRIRSAATIEMSLAADSKRKTDSTLSERKRKNRATQTQNKAHYTNAHGPKSIRTGVLIFGLIYMMERSVSGTKHSFTNDHETQNDHVMISILLFRTQPALNNWLGY